MASFMPWKTVSVGGRSVAWLENDVIAKYGEIGCWQIRGGFYDLQTLKEEMAIDLVEMTACELTLGRPLSQEDYCSQDVDQDDAIQAGLALGLKLCPPETAFHTILQHGASN
jgi:hypothetical protein